MKYLGEAMTIAAVLSYDRNQHCLDFCYAGHPPAMIWWRETGWDRLENTEEEQDTSNLPLGVMAAAVYEQDQISLTPGDRVVIFTDGLLEAKDRHGEPFGVGRLSRVMDAERTASNSGPQICDPRRPARSYEELAGRRRPNRAGRRNPVNSKTATRLDRNL